MHSHCLPVTDKAIVASEDHDYRKASTDSTVTKLCDQLKSLDLQSDSTVGKLQSIGCSQCCGERGHLADGEMDRS